MTEARARFEAWVAPARARPELWRLALGTLLAAAIWVLAVAGLAAAATGPRAGVLAYLFAFGGLILGLALAVRRLHGRSFASLVGPAGFRWRGFAAGALVVACAAALTVGPGLALGGAERNLAPGVWLAWAPLALAGIAVQTSAEELMFRGYLPQQIAARTRARLAWMVLPAAAFGALHWNPMFGPSAWAVAAAAMVTGLVYADVTARLGNLSPAMGLHFANNAVALLVAAPPGPLGAFAFWRAPFDPGDAAAMRAGVAANVAITLLVWGVWRARLARRERALHSKGAGSI